MLSVVARAFNPSTREAQVGRSLLVWGHPGIQSKFQDSQGCYTKQNKTLSWKTKNKKKIKKKEEKKKKKKNQK